MVTSFLSRVIGENLDGEEELELLGELFFGVKSIGKVDPSDSAVGVDLHPEGFYVICSVRSAGEV